MSSVWSEQFPMLNEKMNGKRLAYLDSAATALKPLRVVKRMEDYLLHHTSNVHRGIYKLSEDNTAAYEVVRGQVAKFINAQDVESVIFTKGTTDGLNCVARSWGSTHLSANDEILISELEHHANIVPWQMIALEKKAQIKVIPLNEELQIDLEAFKNLLNPKVKLLALTMISNTLGVITPYKEMIKLAKAHGITVVLDAAQAAPHIPLDVQDLGCDFLVFSAHKVFGPNGVGILWGKKDLLDSLPPYQGGGNMISTVSLTNGTTWNKLPEKFEAGTPVIAEVLGFGEALKFVDEVGFKEIMRLDEDLNHQAQIALQKIPGLKIFGVKSPKVATFGFEVSGLHPQDLGSVLDKEGVAIRTGHHCTQPLMKRCEVSAMARASFGPYNTKEDIQQLVQAIEKACRLFL
ncbi:MAG: SufS family cysteine desulfurase [Bacteriovoracaceae bacterium]|nr:SufS family cysteine desulfurase [Bacteriovoracaceae bacterium]